MNKRVGEGVESRRARLIAFYLPQFHPIPENDEWWEKGFTEWTNVTKAKPLYPGHIQPQLPADLGFYDLRVPEIREAQADLARQYGIEGFCYWHYWFEGKRLIERPFLEVLRSKRPDFPFCLAWANHTWSGIWHGAPNRILIKQSYGGLADHKAHFYALLEAFRDNRYLTVDGKKLFLIYKPCDLPHPDEFIACWNQLANNEGLRGFHFVAIHDYSNWEEVNDLLKKGFSAVTANPPVGLFKYNKWVLEKAWMKFLNCFIKLPSIYSYKTYVKDALPEKMNSNGAYPCVVPNWDTTPRSQNNGFVLHDSSPTEYGRVLKKAVEIVADRPREHRIIFIKSWNEWAEGNFLEPSRLWGKKYLEITRDVIE